MLFGVLLVLGVSWSELVFLGEKMTLLRGLGIVIVLLGAALILLRVRLH